MKTRIACLAVVLAAASVLSSAQTKQLSLQAQIDQIYPQLQTLYIDLHRNPELSLRETKTAAKIADQLKRLGYEVTTGVGGTGVVGVLRNGDGPVVMLRAELDALPVPEKTGLAYASHVMATDDSGAEVPVMHACGHDLHMSVGIGTAALLAQNKAQWHGMFIYVGQPAEERIVGARAMLDAGLFTRFPRPTYAVAVHDTPVLPAGKVGYTPGYAMANADSVDVTIYGRGGHGSAPQVTVDPIVIAARTILAWQTIISRENSPFDPAVITVGSIHAGLKNNIIPDDAKLQLTVRSYKGEVRDRLIREIEHVAKAEAEAAGAPKPPTVAVVESVMAVYNDPKLTQQVVSTLKQTLGDANVVEVPPLMAADDFAEYGRAGVPEVMLSLGAVNPQKFEEAKKTGEVLPGLHSSSFAPDLEPSLKTGVLTEATVVLQLLGH
jgi:hippurate hydrolase